MLPVTTQSERARAALHAYYTSDLGATLTLHHTRDPFEQALALFRDAAAHVPAYGRFLAEHGVDPSRVLTRADFGALPSPTKDSYYRRHALPELCREGRLERSDFVAVSSGSTGEPAIWPRFVSDELGTAFRFEQVLADAFGTRS